MESVIITLPNHLYQSLQQRAAKEGKALDAFTVALIEGALQEVPESPTNEKEAVRQILQATGRLRPLSTNLRERIIPGVTLEEVQMALSRTGGESLSRILLAQRERDV